MKKERETAGKMAARAYAQSYLDDLVPSVFTLLVEQGFFFDTAERGLTWRRLAFGPADRKEVRKIMIRIITNHAVVSFCVLVLKIM